MPLELDSLRNAVAALRRSIEVAENEERDYSAAEREAIRAGVIKNFSLSYLLCIRALQLYLSQRMPEDPEMLRSSSAWIQDALDIGLIDDSLPWAKYEFANHRRLNTYDKEIEAEVFQVSIGFCRDGERLISRLDTLKV